MAMKKRAGSERGKRNSGDYFAIERRRQGAFASHPKGIALPALHYVKALHRGPAGPLFALFLVQHPAGAMSRLSLVSDRGPC